MDKKLRNILILAGVLVLLCIGYAVAGVVFPDEEEGETETSAEETAAAFLNVTEDGLTALSYTFDKDGDGEAELWEYVRSEDGETWTWVGDRNIPLNSSVFYSISGTLATVSSVSAIENVTEEQLAEFGLVTPAKTIAFTDKEGGRQSFCIGVYNTYNGTYCAYKNGDKSTVYLLEGDFYANFEYAVESFVSYDDLPEFDPEDLVTLTLTQGERTVVLARGFSEAGDVVWQRKVGDEAPVTVAADLARSLDLLAGDMDYLICYGVAESDFPEYGLHENTTCMTTVYKKTVDGEEVEKTFTLTLGGVDDYSYYYANPEGTTLTMLLGGSVFHKVMTYDDAHLAAGDTTAETDTAN